MDNIDKILWPDRAGQFDPSLYVHIMTNGLYKSTVKVEPFEYEISDVGGSQSERGKWLYCMDGLHYVIFVADLNAYCQTLREDSERASLLSKFFVVILARLTNTSAEPATRIP